MANTITSAPPPTAQAQNPVAAAQAARAKTQQTGVDQDAALGDPDHDGPAAKAAANNVKISAGSPAAANVLTLNAASNDTTKP